MAFSTLDAALAAAEAGLKVFPLPPLSKAPPPKGWQELATTDPVAIQEFFRLSPRSNYGIRTGSVNDLIVIDLDGPGAQAWWREHGFESGAVVMTPSGPDRTHHYFRIAGVELPNSQSKLAPNIDVRGEGGYVVGPQSVLSTGTYRGGSFVGIPDAPDALIALIPEKQTYVSEAREGDKALEPSESELRQIESGIRDLGALPRPWVEGAGWRSTFYRVACWYARMVNSPDYALTERGALDLLLEHAPSDEAWGREEQLTQWASAVKSTAGQYAAPVGPSYPAIISLPAAAKLETFPQYASTGEPFTDVVFADPAPEDPTGEDRRTFLYVECRHAGMTIEQAASVARGSKTGTLVPEADFWKQMEAAEAMAATAVNLPGNDERPKGKSKRVEILTPDERAEVETDQEWFGARYLAWAESRVAMLNPPYHRLNSWMLLSLVYADVGYIPLPAGPTGVNLFGTMLGKSTTGKSEAMKLFKSCLKVHFHGDSNPNLGGSASPNALIEKLIERDGKPSLFITDEAHGLFKQMSGEGSWMSGLKELLTGLFEGEVSMILRTGNKEVSGKDAVTYFNTHFTGTVAQMEEVLDEGFWTSGLGNRMIWAIGTDLEPSEDAHDARQVEGYGPSEYDAMPRQWSAEFQVNRDAIKELVRAQPGKILMDRGALSRQTKVQRALAKIPIGHKHEELLKPAMIRLGINIWKAACLAAMSRGSATISLHDELIAIEAGEEWLNNILRLVGTTTDSAFAREVSKVEAYIVAQKNSEARPDQIYAHSSRPKQEVDKYIDQLAAEKRIIKHQIPNSDNHVWKAAA